MVVVVALGSLRDLARDLVVEGAFPVGQVGRRAGRLGADERGVGVVGHDLDLAPGGDVGGGADVIGVEVGQDQPAQVFGLVAGLADRRRDQRRGAGQAGVDEREAVGVVP